MDRPFYGPRSIILAPYRLSKCYGCVFNSFKFFRHCKVNILIQFLNFDCEKLSTRLIFKLLLYTFNGFLYILKPSQPPLEKLPPTKIETFRHIFSISLHPYLSILTTINFLRTKDETAAVKLDF